MINEENDGLINISVYGSLKKGFGNHRLLANSRFLSHGVIKDAILVSLSAYPALYINQLLGDNVQVEIYRVTPEEFRSLDMLEGYDTFYNRTEVSIEVVSGVYIRTWIYHFNGDYKGQYPRVPAVNGIANWTISPMIREDFYA